MTNDEIAQLIKLRDQAVFILMKCWDELAADWDDHGKCNIIMTERYIDDAIKYLNQM